MNLLNIKLLPLTVVIGFNLFTVLIFLSAPMNWATDNLYIFTAFFLICQIMIIGGYLQGFQKVVRLDIPHTVFYKISNIKLSLIFFFYAATMLIKYAFSLKFNLLDIKGMVLFCLTGLIDPRTTYIIGADPTRPYTINWSLYFLTSIINQLFFIIGFIKWKEMSLLKKIFFILFVIIELFYWMGRGTNFGVICMITTVTFVFIDRFKLLKLNFRKTLSVSVLIFLLFMVSFTFFAYNMDRRGDGGAAITGNFAIGSSTVRESSAIFSIIPESLHNSYLLIVSYMTQGYYHTCLAFDLDFKSTYFLGNNPGLISLAGALGIYVWENTYMYGLGAKYNDVDDLAVWHSAYTWYANDVSFFGVPFVLFILGYLYGLSRNLSLKYNDFLSKVMFIIFGNMLLFLFANNTYLSSVFYSFMFVFPIWYFTRVKGIICRR